MVLLIWRIVFQLLRQVLIWEVTSQFAWQQFGWLRVKGRGSRKGDEGTRGKIKQNNLSKIMGGGV